MSDLNKFICEQIALGRTLSQVAKGSVESGIELSVFDIMQRERDDPALANDMYLAKKAHVQVLLDNASEDMELARGGMLDPKIAKLTFDYAKWVAEKVDSETYGKANERKRESRVDDDINPDELVRRLYAASANADNDGEDNDVDEL